jgi:7-cyano-7-deazaguanine synthase
MIPKTIISLLSGGLDSVTGLYDLVDQGHLVSCVGIDYGQRHVQELECARYHCRRLNVVFTRLSIGPLRGSTLTDGTGGVVVPNRNSILLDHAVNIAVAAGADTVTYFCNRDDEANFPDCRRAFVQAYNIKLLNSEIKVEVCAPYMDRAKWWIAGKARELGVEVNQTWSCYRGGAVPCGECEACQKREAALVRACVKGQVVV